MTEFSFPWQYNFPPFYTIQPHGETRRKQLAAWRSLVLDYCQHHGIASIEVKAIAQTPLFHNQVLRRRLDDAALSLILEDLRSHGHLEWLDKTKSKALVYYRSPQQWGEAIYAYARENGLQNSVCTLYELTEGDDTVEQPFHNLNQDVLIKALKSLQMQKKAEIFDNNEGVKFF